MPEPIMLSALEHYAFCPRQCALIHVEQVWDENLYTLRGQINHKRADEPGDSRRSELGIERAMPLWSEKLGLVGKADVVEFRDGIPYPVEYKSGHRREGVAEKIQLCAQALCLEEMLGVSVAKGALYWHGSRSRDEVVFDAELRNLTGETARLTAEMIHGHIVPEASFDERCTHCSLKFSCMPQLHQAITEYTDDTTA